ncbi:hypothetical protein [Caballeronia ptereochthonis]|uniref:Uncharacterized protein n=1 Tax=Caballeronia ptereochthonis TaxID=1777144 RepID=A0A158DEH0_9BURK|nr:hypothetical protein [Caballeronia ptereochthonis]SAK92951.1 hypothetical protein AWB83_05375 [Caballeronia ptereochthonis]
MRRKSSGVAVAAVLVGVAVAAVLYIASFGKSRHADAPVPSTSALAATQDATASAAAFGVAPGEAKMTPGEQTVAR